MYERFFQRLCEKYKTAYVQGHFSLCSLNYLQEKRVRMEEFPKKTNNYTYITKNSQLTGKKEVS